jgi:hypothetical protein
MEMEDDGWITFGKKGRKSYDFGSVNQFNLNKR